MSLSQALSVALAGVHVTQQGLSVIAGNVANANTPGYVDETVTPVEVASGGSGGSSVDSSGINRNLNTLLQTQLWTETSGGSYADATAQLGERGRLLVRPSGTEPVIRVMGEADDQALVDALVSNVCDAVAGTA